MLTAAGYAVCLIVAALTVPSLQVFLTYGLPTWVGGALFTVLVQRGMAARREPS